MNDSGFKYIPSPTSKLWLTTVITKLPLDGSYVALVGVTSALPFAIASDTIENDEEIVFRIVISVISPPASGENDVTLIPLSVFKLPVGTNKVSLSTIFSIKSLA